MAPAGDARRGAAGLSSPPRCRPRAHSNRRRPRRGGPGSARRCTTRSYGSQSWSECDGAVGRCSLRRAVGPVEIGAGTGLNVAHYPDQLHELVLVEPEPAMRERLTRRIRRAGCQAAVVDAPAEALPFPDGSVDTVVCTLVLVHGACARQGAGRNPASASPGRPTAVHRARPRRLADPCLLSGPDAGAVATVRVWMPL